MSDRPSNSVSTPAGDAATSNDGVQKQETMEQAINNGHNIEVFSTNHVPEDIKDEKKPDNAPRCTLAKSHDIEKGTGMNSETTAVLDDNAGGITPAEDEDTVWWEENDPENPYNWSTWAKFLNVSFIIHLNFLTPLGSAMIAPAVAELMSEFGADNNAELAAFVVSVYILGFAAGLLVMAPLSEIYGRLPVYHACNIGLTVFTVACALAPSLSSLIAFRFLSGVFGSSPICNGAGTIADLIVQERRGSVVAIYSIGPLLGPIIGPITGGPLASALGWRWVCWILAIEVGSLAITMMIFAKETYAPVLLQRRVERLRKDTGNELLHSKLDSGLSPFAYFKQSIVRPLRLLIFSPLCTVYAFYVAIVYGYLYTIFTSISPIFIKFYHFTTGTVGLVFIGLGAGTILGMVYYGYTSDRALKANSERDGEGMKPEYRLAPLPFGTILLPVGLFIYGWTTQYHVHWIVPILSHVLM